ncbi:DUF4382 domain-containing protein [Shewanella eurypsychrophilus]|uniref:DUF4382 domain-containing protein n=1 Tax=Shewanella eurypsychrophilus TaxID=2593656 RepID=A0ABX6V617_9GAMM|nr:MULTISPECIES: DUF4382 domain-containing protein [Shewanella]QFU22774.1 DUF4382 domain-containing protein [Shewanella sp. YLB-09]QPG58063.1 DUF4382 domain-containing protein [Shewanella eurypsychrophilus]
MKTTSALLVSSFLLFSACGSDGTDPKNEPVLSTGQLSLGISDSPMTGVSHLGLVLNELIMTDAAGVIHKHDLQGMTFNLLDFQGMDSHSVISGIEFPEGNYHDVYITTRQGDGNQSCYVEDGQGRHGLHVTDGRLPVMDFDLVQGQHLSLTMEIDLYRGLSYHQGQYQLNHEGMWSVDNRYMGHLIGEVDPQWIADCESTYSSTDPIGGQFTHLAYLYPNTVTGITQMADMATMTAPERTTPSAVSPMMQDIDGNWHFAMGYLPAGEYRVGYSCLGHLDDPITDDISNGTFVMFKDSGSITIETGSQGGQETVHQCGNGNGGHHGGGHH